MSQKTCAQEIEGSRLAAAIVKRIRKGLGLTQQGLAQSLGISTKAVQSYEQGWREVPGRVMMQVLVLCAVHRRSYEDETPCWEIKGCSSEERQTCISYTLGNGRFCWFLTARMAKSEAAAPDPDMQQCLRCPVLERLLNRANDEGKKEPISITGREVEPAAPSQPGGGSLRPPVAPALLVYPEADPPAARSDLA